MPIKCLYRLPAFHKVWRLYSQVYPMLAHLYWDRVIRKTQQSVHHDTNNEDPLKLPSFSGQYILTYHVYSVYCNVAIVHVDQYMINLELDTLIEIVLFKPGRYLLSTGLTEENFVSFFFFNLVISLLCFQISSASLKIFILLWTIFRVCWFIVMAVYLLLFLLAHVESYFLTRGSNPHPWVCKEGEIPIHWTVREDPIWSVL